MGEVDPRALRERLAAGLAAMGMSVGDAESAGLIAYLALPVKWSRAYNLTAVRDPLEMVPRHLLHSLSVAPYLFGDSVLDLGTGAGLPGIPLALLNPKRRFWGCKPKPQKIPSVQIWPCPGRIQANGLSAISAHRRIDATLVASGGAGKPGTNAMLNRAKNS
jgi:hypothetical protein